MTLYCFCSLLHLTVFDFVHRKKERHRVVLLWATRAAPVQPAQLHPPPPVFTPAVAEAARRKSGEQRGGRRRDCSLTHFPPFFHPLHSLFLEVVGDLVRHWEGRIWEAGRRLPLLPASMGGWRDGSRGYPAAVVPALAWPWLVSGAGAHARGWPATTAAWLACARNTVPESRALAIGRSAAVNSAFCSLWYGEG